MKNGEMTLGQMTKRYIGQLHELYPPEECREIAYLVFQHCLGHSKTDVVLKAQVPLERENRNALEEILAELMQHKPVQYVLGKTEFCGLSLQVNEHVLIPRPETEELVRWVIDSSAHLEHPRILDIGTGSGCIAIALKKHIPQSEMQAIDISEKAIATASRKATMNGTDISFVQGDITAQGDEIIGGEFDVIVSNPPYVKRSEMSMMQKNVLDYEPHIALFAVNNDPLMFYLVISDFAMKKLARNGSLFFEINASLGEQVKALLQDRGFSEVTIRQDINGKDRMALARR